MKYVKLGSTGLKVSRICLGMMSFGTPPDPGDPSWRDWHLTQETAEPIVRRAVEVGVTFFDTADMYAQGAGERVTGALLKGLFPRREDYVLATKVYFLMGAGANDQGLSRRPHPRRHRRLAAAARHGLRRPLPDPPVGRGHPRRGDDGGARRRGPGGQGPLRRRVEHVRLAVREGPDGREGERLGAVRDDAEPLQPGLPRGGAGDDPAVPGPGRGSPPVQPTGPRAPGSCPAAG